MDKNAILERLHQLPAMPLVVREVMASFNDDRTGSAVLAHKIAHDQGLSAKVLQVANSSFYGLPREIGSIHEAVTVLGFDTVRSLVLSAGFMRTFPAAEGKGFDRHAYWLRSFRVATYTEALAKCLGKERPMSFSAGMFHDVGQLVLDACIPEQFAAVLALQVTSGRDLIECERAELGFDHAEIGAEMARRWNFPAKIEHAIRYWRTPEHEPYEAVTGMVHLAAALECGAVGEALIDSLPAALRDRMQISWPQLEACLPPPQHLDATVKLMLATQD
jgi:putative nucleotidyltransferase with HDIG domain